MRASGEDGGRRRQQRAAAPVDCVVATDAIPGPVSAHTLGSCELIAIRCVDGGDFGDLLSPGVAPYLSAGSGGGASPICRRGGRGRKSEGYLSGRCPSG